MACGLSRETAGTGPTTVAAPTPTATSALSRAVATDYWEVVVDEARVVLPQEAPEAPGGTKTVELTLDLRRLGSAAELDLAESLRLEERIGTLYEARVVEGPTGGRLALATGQQATVTVRFYLPHTATGLVLVFSPRDEAEPIRLDVGM